jgi:hypothetical protein
MKWEGSTVDANSIKSRSKRSPAFNELAISTRSQDRNNVTDKLVESDQLSGVEGIELKVVPAETRRK